MLFNNILIILILIAIVAFAMWKKKQLDMEDEEEFDTEDTVELDIRYLVSETSRAFSRTLKKNLNEDNLTQDELRRKQKRKSNLRKALTEASYGDETAKRTVKNYIRELLLDPKYEIDEESINRIIPFDNIKTLKETDMTEIVLYAYVKKYGSNGFEEMMDEWDLARPIKTESGEMRYKVTKDAIKMVYQALYLDDEEFPTSEKLGKVKLDFMDKVEILTQRVYERYIGFGAVDMLYYSTIDELDVGTSGISKGAFSVKTDTKNLPYSYESIWITYKGLNIQLECLKFESQDELIRVVDNVYKYDAPYVLSRSKGYVISTMIDGSRIVAIRPPFSESYGFFLRKFDSTPSIEPITLIEGKNKDNEHAIIPVVIMKWFMKTHRNIAITGGQATGKSTLLKAFIRYIDPALNLRIQELQFELNLRFTYPDRNIVTFQETSKIDAQEGLNLQKKTNGAVNIVGEVANAIQASHVIQTSMVASLFTMFTHHAKTARRLVEAMANNLLELGLYKDKKDAINMVASVVNVDCHLVNIKGKRHIERITEIVPTTNTNWPSDYAAEDVSGQEKAFMDAVKYFRESVDPNLFEVKDIVHWYPIIDEKTGKEIGGKFKLVNMPSKETLMDMKEKLSYEEEKEFDHDMEMLKILSEQGETEEVKKWMESVSI